jgi:cytochrome c oxidase assembly protein subunit 11
MNRWMVTLRSDWTNRYRWPSLGHRQNSISHQLRKRNRTVLLYSSAVIVLFAGASYASVPLYRIFCQKTGYAGTPKRVVSYEHREPDISSKPIRINFNADVASNLPWTFRPQQKEIRVVPGETALAFYTVHNQSDRELIGVSSYNVIPDSAGAYFHKIQFFCFEDQRLGPYEQVDMPVLFYIDRSFSSDPYLRNTDRLTLSYTFFLSKDPAT